MASFCLDRKRNINQSSYSSTINDIFPLEILLEIFYQLPFKELHRNKTVCKFWSSVISHPSFRFQYSVRTNYSSTINDTLPLKTLEKILYKLTVEELHRNKAVCKFWSSIISHPSFSSEYSLIRRNSSSPPPSYTLYLNFYQHLSNNDKRWSINNPRLSLNFLRSPPISHGRTKSNYKVLASSKGLLLCSMTYDRASDHLIYLVVNPFMKQGLHLRSPPTFSREVVLSGIVCSDESSNQIHQFKVVRIVRESSNIVSNFLDIEIFESVTKRWRVLRKKVDSKISISTSVNVVEHKGILYWATQPCDSIIAFNSNHDLCLRIPLPGIYDAYFDSEIIGVSQDHLYYVRIVFRISNIPCTIWRCDEFEGKYTWSVHRSLDLDKIDQRIKKICPDYLDLDLEFIAIDPMDCNILYLKQHQHFYSLDVERREMMKLCSCSYTLNFYPHERVMFVEPTWPPDLRKLYASN